MRGSARLIVAVALVAVALASLRLARPPRTLAATGLSPPSSQPSEESSRPFVEGSVEEARSEREAATEPRPGESVSRAAPPATGATSRLDLRVTRDGDPTSGVLVNLYGDEDGRSALLLGASPGRAAAATRTSSDGVATLPDLRPGPYVAAVGEAVEPPCRLAFVVLDAEPSRLSVSLGSASLEGRVFGADGRPAPGARVVARQDAPGDEPRLWFLSSVDERGAYRVAGLAGGPQRPVTVTVLDLALGRALPIELAPGERRFLDLGSPLGHATWSGTVRTPSGAPFEQAERLLFTREGVMQHDGYCSGDGRFRIALPAGTYDVHLGSRAGCALGEAQVGGDLALDLILPACVLRGRVRYTGTRHERAAGPASEVVLTLARAGSPAAPASALRSADRYAFCGLEPGSYVLTSRPWPLTASAVDGLAIEVEPGQEELVLDVEVADP